MLMSPANTHMNKDSIRKWDQDGKRKSSIQTAHGNILKPLNQKCYSTYNTSMVFSLPVMLNPCPSCDFQWPDTSTPFQFHSQHSPKWFVKFWFYQLSCRSLDRPWGKYREFCSVFKFCFMFPLVFIRYFS